MAHSHRHTPRAHSAGDARPDSTTHGRLRASVRNAQHHWLQGDFDSPVASPPEHYRAISRGATGHESRHYLEEDERTSRMRK